MPTACLSGFITSSLRYRPAGLARFWTQAPGWTTCPGAGREIVTGLRSRAGLHVFPADHVSKTVKNRLHLDLTSSAKDRDQEIERLVALGARRAGVGATGAESWTVPADPRKTGSA